MLLIWTEGLENLKSEPNCFEQGTVLAHILICMYLHFVTKHTCMPIHNIGKVLVLKFRTYVSTVVLRMNIIFACVFMEMHSL
jgi:hypothetical protein